MSKIQVEHWDEEVDGTLNAENIEKKLRKQGYTSTRYTFSPGTTFPDHTHAHSKKDAIASGKYRFSMFGEVVFLKPGDMIEVPANTVHNAEVVGDENVVFFDATRR